MDDGPDAIGNPVRDRARLTGAGPGDHAHRAAGGKGHLTLLGIERGEHRLRAVVHRAPPSPLSSLRIGPTCGEAQSRVRRCTSRNTVGEDRETRVSQRVTMYTTQWCGFCRRLKGQLAREGIEVAEIDIERDPAAADYVMSVNGGNQTVPTIVFPDGTALTNPSAAQVRGRLAALVKGS